MVLFALFLKWDFVSFLSCLSISVPVQNSFSGLHRDFSQQMQNLVNTVTLTKENVTALEKKVNTLSTVPNTRTAKLQSDKKNVLLITNCHNFLI